MGAESVGRDVAWKVGNLDGGKNEVAGRIMAFVPARTLLTTAMLTCRARGSIRKGIKDRSAIDRYVVEVLERRAGPDPQPLTPRLYVPNAGTIDLALLPGQRGGA